MKRKLLLVLFGLVLFGAFVNAQTLDEAVIGAAVKISRDLPSGATAAVIAFYSDSEELNDYVTNELYGAILRNRRITPIKPDQSQLQSIRGELGSGTAGTLNSEAAQNIGRLLGTQYLITGLIESTGSEYTIIFNAVYTDAEIKSQYSAVLNPQNDSQLASLLGAAAESETVAASGKPQREKKQGIADAEIKNWVSLNAAFIGMGLNYEYMINSKISAGANIYWNFISNLNLLDDEFITANNYAFPVYAVGIDAAFRLYPSGKIFFMGTALGFYFVNGIAGYYYDNYSTFYSFALGITPEIGWRIDVDKKGGVYLQTGIAVLFVFGKENTEDPRYDPPWFKDKDKFGLIGNYSLPFFPRVYFGVGYAF